MKKIIFALALSALACGCSQNNGVNYTINGNMPDLLSGMVYLLNDEGMPIDSTNVSQGKFTLKGNVEEECFAYLVQYPSFMTMVMLENGKLNVEGSPEEPLLSGTPANDGYRDMIETFAVINSDEETNPDSLKISSSDFLSQAFEKNKDNIFGVYLMQNMVFMMPAEQVLAAYDSLAEKFKNREDVLQIKERAEKMAATEVGKRYIDVAMPTAAQEEKKLSDLVNGGNYVLLDFWASWCTPCMAEVPYLVSSYEKYNKKGFEIFGVSLDNDAEAWVNAYENNDMNWVQVSNVAGWKTAAAEEYGVVAIPANFLIAPDGTIVAKNLRGEELEEKLAEIFGR